MKFGFIYLKLVLVIIIIIIFASILLVKFEYKKPNRISSILGNNFLNKSVSVNLFDLNKNLEPFDVYNPIKCRTSANIYVTTTLCIHKQPELISDEIWRTGSWEVKILRSFLKYVKKNPEWLVLDIGANLGVYSLYAAQMGRDVISVEPFYDNQIRIHKAAKMENIQNKITLIGNALSDKRNELKRLHSEQSNIGRQSLYKHKNEMLEKNEALKNDKYIVETILLDDIVPFFPKNKNGKDYTEAIMKIDIEGFEIYAFKNATNLFQKLKINVIFMEWVFMTKKSSNFDLVEKLIEFLYSNKLKPFIDNKELDRKNWMNWPIDIVWKRGKEFD